MLNEWSAMQFAAMQFEIYHFEVCLQESDFSPSCLVTPLLSKPQKNKSFRLLLYNSGKMSGIAL